MKLTLLEGILCALLFIAVIYGVPFLWAAVSYWRERKRQQREFDGQVEIYHRYFEESR